MKKSTRVVLSTVMLAAIVSCRNDRDQWIRGDENGRLRDTTVNGAPYRYYGGMWYPIVAGFISPSTYRGGTTREISTPGYKPGRAVRSGGFGSSARSTSA